jgi:Fur family ferric uptake transcriptional regulator
MLNDRGQSKKLTQALRALRQAGLKHTRCRVDLLNFILGTRSPFGIDEILENTGGLDPSTAYRNLATFERLGLVHRCDLGDGILRFETRLEGAKHHHLVVCTACRRLERLNVCSLSELESSLLERGYTEVRHTLEFFGRCPSCSK